ncbi:MAG TPA: branched-chain amino acid aminotransferase [Flavitalea sp.]|nr:branched-chain amino acid aminotransferase [Flavitalea sp.]
MIADLKIPVTRVEQSRLKESSLENIPFGKIFTDHMLEADYEDGEWKNVEIKPYQPLVLNPSNAAIHYGQSIFEGIKAYRFQTGDAYIFRPEDNYRRFNKSAARMQMPSVPKEIFMDGMAALLAIDKNWIPQFTDHSLYIRPFMFATDESIGVKPSSSYKFMIILSPTGPYYAAPMKIYVEEKYTRAAPGGIGFAKAAGNYAASLLATTEAKALGYDQVLWTDAFEHRYVQEIGTMNVFFLIGDTVVTPGLENGTILEGVTRDSAIRVMGDLGYKLQERPVTIDELIDAYRAGTLLEVFGTGTAATISLIRELRYKDFVMDFDVNTWKLTPALKHQLTAIREGKIEDPYGWMVQI